MNPLMEIFLWSVNSLDWFYARIFAVGIRAEFCFWSGAVGSDIDYYKELILGTEKKATCLVINSYSISIAKYLWNFLSQVIK